jgi:hypothetical protein
MSTLIALSIFLWHLQHQLTTTIKTASNGTEVGFPFSKNKRAEAPSKTIHWSNLPDEEKTFWWIVSTSIVSSIITLTCLICYQLWQGWIRDIDTEPGSEPRILLQQLVTTMQELDTKLMGLIQQLEKGHALLQNRRNHRLLLYCIICSQDRLIRLQNVMDIPPPVVHLQGEETLISDNEDDWGKIVMQRLLWETPDYAASMEPAVKWEHVEAWLRFVREQMGNGRKGTITRRGRVRRHPQASR